MKPTKKTTPEAWARENRKYPSSSGRPGMRDPGFTPYAVPFSSFFDDPRYETAIFITGTQSGKTDTMLDVIGWRLDTRPRPILYVGPSREFVTEQFEPRLTQLFDQSRRLASRVARGKRNKKFIKIVNGVRVRMAWAGSPTSLASDQAGDVFIDEYSKMFRMVTKAGDPFVLAKARADSYADRKIAVASTPENGKVETEKDPASGLEFWKVAESDNISCQTWLRWQTGTRHHFAWQCPHCSEWFIPRYRDLNFPEGASPAEARRSTFLCCPVNGCVIEETAKETMNAGGRMVAPGEFIRPDGSIGGDPPDSTTLSLWASGLTSPFISWGERVEEILTGKLIGDPTAVKAAMNKVGELHFDQPIATKSIEDLEENIVAGFFLGDVPREALRLTMGADVQGNRIVYVVRGWGSLARSWLIDAGEVWGQTSHEEVWARFAIKLQDEYEGLRIERGLIDSGFRPDKKEAGDYHKVYQFCQRYAWIVNPAKGKLKQSVPLIVKPYDAVAQGRRQTLPINLAWVDTDYFKSLVHSRIWTPPGQPGAFHLPEDASADYRKQLLSEFRSDDGEWHKSYGENHFFDAEVLAAAAGFMLQVQRIPEGAIREAAPKIDRPEKPKVEPPPAGLSLRERMAQRSARFNK